MNNCVIAYLDLLGFKNVTTSDPDGALRLLESYSTTLQKDKQDFDSFEYFLPFSDSIFIMASDPNIFIKQLSSFLVKSFNESMPVMLHDNPTKRTEIGFSTIEEMHEGLAINIGEAGWKEDHAVTQYPALFRGGIACGDYKLVDNIEVIAGIQGHRKNLFGKAMVKAVSLEQSGKGPRIFADKKFYDLLNDDNKQCLQSISNDCYEILWPLYYIKEHFDGRYHYFWDFFSKIVKLWKHFNHMEYGVHYYELIKLFVLSFGRCCEIVNFSSGDRDALLEERIKHEGFESKMEDLKSLLQ